MFRPFRMSSLATAVVGATLALGSIGVLSSTPASAQEAPPACQNQSQIGNGSTQASASILSDLPAGTVVTLEVVASQFVGDLIINVAGNEVARSTGSAGSTLSFTIPNDTSGLVNGRFTVLEAPQTTFVSIRLSITCPGEDGGDPAAQAKTLSKALAAFLLEESVPNMADGLFQIMQGRMFPTNGGKTLPVTASRRGVRVQLADAARAYQSSPAYRQYAAKQPGAVQRYWEREDRRWNAWVDFKGTALNYGQSGFEFDGSLYNLFGGIDFKPTQGTLIGAFIGYEWFDLGAKNVSNVGLDGNGITGGLYGAVKLTDKLVWDLAIGFSALNYDLTLGSRQGSYNGHRLFVSTNVTGTWRFGPQKRFRITPRLGMIYAVEHQFSYTDNQGTRVGDQYVRLGRLRFGPEVGYRFNVGQKMALEPYASIIGEYDFSKSGALTLADGSTTEPGRFGARATVGLKLAVTDMIHVRGAFTYAGIGRKDDYSAMTGNLELSITW